MGREKGPPIRRDKIAALTTFIRVAGKLILFSIVISHTGCWLCRLYNYKDAENEKF